MTSPPFFTESQSTISVLYVKHSLNYLSFSVHVGAKDIPQKNRFGRYKHLGGKTGSLAWAGKSVEHGLQLTEISPVPHWRHRSVLQGFPREKSLTFGMDFLEIKIQHSWDLPQDPAQVIAQKGGWRRSSPNSVPEAQQILGCWLPIEVCYSWCLSWIGRILMAA